MLAHHIGIVASAYKLVEDLQFGLAESTENLNGVVHDFQSDSSAGLVFPKIGADVQVKLLADLKHFRLRSGMYDLLQHYLGRLEVFIGNSNHFCDANICGGQAATEFTLIAVNRTLIGR